MIRSPFKIEDLCEITSSKRIFAKEYQDSGIPFYRGKEITEKYNGFLNVTTELFITEEKYEEVRGKHGVPKAGDMLLTSVGTLGSTYIVMSSDKFYFKDGNLTWFRNFNGLNSTYLKYWLESPVGKGELKKSTIGAAQPAYTIFNLKNMRISLPSEDEQKDVVKTISTYDNLIENNNRRIAILEDMAQSLYKEWFVKFRFPGHQNTKFKESSLGLIPEGWEVKPLDEVAAVNPENISNQNKPESIGYIDIKSVSTGSISEIRSMQFTDAPSRARRIVTDGDIIWATVRPNRRQYSYICRPVENTIASTGFAVLRAKKVPSSYLYFNTTTDNFSSYLVNHATGSAYPAVNANVFEKARVLFPSKELLKLFDEIAGNTIHQCDVLKKKNGILQKQRDLLLPKLISETISIN